jgi:hypothetical protein
MRRPPSLSDAECVTREREVPGGHYAGFDTPLK